MSPPVVLRDAATIMLVRDVARAGGDAGDTTMEVLMLRRNAQSVLASASRA